MSALQGSKDNGEGWIEWGGGKCPVATGTLVDIEQRDGQKLGRFFGSEVDWSREVMDDDIIAYRIHKES